ncbi:hypothetical protein JCM15060_11910 [Halanaerobaculum tunisiense]
MRDTMWLRKGLRYYIRIIDLLSLYSQHGFYAGWFGDWFSLVEGMEFSISTGC